LGSHFVLGEETSRSSAWPRAPETRIRRMLGAPLISFDNGSAKARAQQTSPMIPR